MNKKYNEFPAGTYDTNKIFLQADPATGYLEQVHLPRQLPYMLFNALLLQTAGNNPTTTELYNSLGATITITRVNAGIYNINSNSAIFTLTKTMLFMAPTTNYPILYSYTIIDASNIQLHQVSASGTSEDTMFYNPLEIRVYP